jgi:hypothetical protein
MMKLLHCILFLAAFVVSGGAAACPRHIGPGNFLNSPAAWGNDSGPIVDGFIDVLAENGTVLKVAHGVDLSRYNRMDYTSFNKCGGTFAFVQMDRQFHEHAIGVQAHGATVIPYFFFKLPKKLRQASALLDSDKAEGIELLRKAYIEAGEKSARDFLASLQKFNQQNSSKWPMVAELAGLKGKFIAFDVEERPLDRLTKNQAQQYGRGYAAAVCAWIKTVEAELSEVIPIIYTFPAIYGDYLAYAYPEENKCLQGHPIWLARTFKTGGEALVDKDNPGTIDKYVQRLCRVPGGNRCIVHQYSHRGVFMAKESGRPGGIPPHFDLNRFYHAELQRSRSGIQFVRQHDPFR